MLLVSLKGPQREPDFYPEMAFANYWDLSYPVHHSLFGRHPKNFTKNLRVPSVMSNVAKAVRQHPFVLAVISGIMSLDQKGSFIIR